MKHFFAVLDLDRLADGEATLVEAEGRCLALFRRGDAIFATQDVCPHRGGPLWDGEIVGSEVVCPWHGSRFDLRSGRCVKGPATKPIAIYATRVRDGKIEVEMETT